MRDPRLELTQQDLTYCAHALRLAARQHESDAAASGVAAAVRQSNEYAARTYDALADKLKGLAKRLEQQPDSTRRSR